MAALKIYGENAFTFLFFDDAVRNNGVRTLLGNLKCFARPRAKFPAASISLDAEPEVWLFPNLGKRTGFGEPDAIMMIDRYAFWFEVETDVELGSAEQPFRQLARCHYAAQALRRGPSLQEKGFAYAGPTVSDRDERKDARLRLRGHQASAFLRALGSASEHHYVLFSVHKPRGDGDWRANLPARATSLFSEWDRIAGLGDPSECFPLCRAWYVYWEGDLKRFAKGVDPVESYVPIKRT
jgi:hypothetical protein